MRSPRCTGATSCARSSSSEHAADFAHRSSSGSSSGNVAGRHRDGPRRSYGVKRSLGGVRAARDALGGSHARASNGATRDRSRWDRGHAGRHRHGDGQRLPGHRAGGVDQPGELHAEHQPGRGLQDRPRPTGCSTRAARSPRSPPPPGTTPPGTFTRNNIVAFNAANGNISTSFAPNFNGDVWAIVPSGTSLYVGGNFSTVNGVARRGAGQDRRDHRRRRHRLQRRR